MTFYFKLFFCCFYLSTSFLSSTRNHILFHTLQVVLESWLAPRCLPVELPVAKNGSKSFLSRLLLRLLLRKARRTHLSSQLYSPLTKYKLETKHTSKRMDGSLSLRINLPQIRYSCGSFLHINSCIYRDYFGNLLAFTLEICAGSLLHPWLLSSINLI